ncbi:Iron complex transport system substrate-binding protein/vitamin B12 transport system substrate-binding protein OS=Castellaniella defragrans OX=75697 GN=HNR28_001468 PE=4 SV=1 [Castellaniella defragrans]
MKRMRLLSWLLAGACVAGAAHAAPQRIVALGGGVTEIVYDLGQGGRLVADDLSSLYPEAATRLPRVGYYRALPLEGILSVKPDLVLASENAGPRSVLDRIQGMGVAVERVSDSPSLSSLYTRVDEIARALDVPDRGAALSAHIRTKVEQAQGQPGTPRHTLVLMNRTGQFMAAGAQTAAHEILNLAGLHNVLSRQTGYKPLSAEGVAALAPDLIIITKASLSGGGMRAFLAQPGIAATPAARAGRVFALDNLLILGLGPRTGEAIRALKQASR